MTTILYFSYYILKIYNIKEKAVFRFGKQLFCEKFRIESGFSLCYNKLRLMWGVFNLERRDKINYYLDLAEVVAQRSTCLRRRYGAVIVQNDEVISTGYVGAPRGRKNCTDMNFCIRSKMNVPRGERYELCRSVHAEANAIISSSRNKMLGSTLYLVGIECDTGEYVENANSCSMCKRMIINAGIAHVIIRDTKDDYRIIHVQKWIEEDESLNGTTGY